jgi:hypothetical protein
MTATLSPPPMIERLNDMGSALCRGGDVEAGEFLRAAAAEIERLLAALQTIADAPSWWEAQQFGRRALEGNE